MTNKKRAEDPAATLRPNKDLKFLPTVPQAVRDYYLSGAMGWEDRTVRCAAAAERLLSDERMREPWAKLGRNFNATGYFSNDPEKWGVYFCWSAVSRFDMAIAPPAWDQMTNREQVGWQQKLDRIVSEFVEHVRVAPLPPGSLGHWLSPSANREFLAHLGLQPWEIPSGRDPFQHVLPFEADDGIPTCVPSDLHGDALLRRCRGEPIDAREIGRALERCGWTIIDELLRFQDAQKVAEAFPQELSKPRDAKAERARFILGLTGNCLQHFGQPMQELVACTTEVMFEDPNITVRLVRRITVGR